MKAALAALAFLCLAHLGLRLRSIPLPMISDEGEYSYQASLLREGGVPYRDAYNQKPPMVFFLYKLSRECFGQGEAAPRLLAALFCWATMFFLFMITPGTWPLAARLTAPGLFSVLSLLPVGDMGFAANTEIFLVAFVAFAFLMLKDPWDSHSGNARLAAAGLAMGMALLTKQTSLWVLLAFGGWSLWKTRWTAALTYAAACAVAPLAFLIYFSHRGAAHDFIEQAWTRNFAYSSVMLPAAGQQIHWLIRTVMPLLLVGSWPTCLLALYGLSKSKASHWEILATLWLAAALVGAATGLFFFPHYFIQALPPLCLAAAMGVRRFGPWAALALCLYPAAVHADFFFRSTPREMAQRLLHPNPLYESAEVAYFLARNTTPEDAIYVFGSEPQIYVYAGRRAATRHIYVYPITLFPLPGEAERELSALKRRLPKFIVYVDIPASTLIASAEGERFREGMRALLRTDYLRRGDVPRDWSDKGLLVFERRRS